MKAFLLAAGRGTRLGALTTTTPKCLLPVGGVPLLRLWLDACARHGIDEALLNLHHLAEPVRAFLAGYDGPVKVHTSYEPELLGTAGTVQANRAFVAGDPEWFVLYADNCTDIDLGDMLAFHRRRRAALTMAVFEAERPEQCGIAVVDADDVVVAFQEKPRAPRSRLASAGVLLGSPAVLERLPGRVPLDFGFDVLPTWTGAMHAYRFDGYLRDVGTPESYARVQDEWPRRRR